MNLTNHDKLFVDLINQNVQDKRRNYQVSSKVSFVSSEPRITHLHYVFDE